MPERPAGTPPAEVRVPALNPNDATYVLIEWLVEAGGQVRPGDAVAVAETSKAAEELVSEAGGTLVHLVPAGTECTPGSVIGRLLPADGRQARPAHAAPPERPRDEVADAAARDEAGPVVTEPARALMEELGIPAARLRELGQKVVRREDVAQLAAAEAAPAPAEPTPAGGRVLALPRTQQAVAATVERSHQTIPAAYAVVRVRAAAALALARRLTRELRTLVGLPELVVAAVARLHPEFPLFFATPLDGHTVRLAEAAHVGVTIDTGNGLFIPVVRDADRQPLAGIAKALMGFRLTAMRGRFTERDLDGANVVVTLATDADVVLTVPIVLPGTTCAVSVAGAHPEPTVGEDGAVTTTPVVNVGAAYDHRVVNGREAVEFLRALKELLESPERLGPPGPSAG